MTPIAAILVVLGLLIIIGGLVMNYKAETGFRIHVSAMVCFIGILIFCYGAAVTIS